MSRHSLKGAKGQAMVEFLVVIPVLILLIFGAIQIGLIYSAKTTLNYATFQAARLAAVNNATYSSIRRGLIRGIAPLYTNSSTLSGLKQDVESGVDSVGSRRDGVMEVDNYMRVIRMNPLSSHFSPAQYGELNSNGLYQIPNDNLMYRPDEIKGSVTIQDANLLKLRVQYCYQLMVPLVNRVIGSLSELNNQRTNQRIYETINDPRFVDANRFFVNQNVGLTASYEQLCKDRANTHEGFILSAEVTIRMQSPAFNEDPEDMSIYGTCDGNRMICP
jgi:hypothetical protein